MRVLVFGIGGQVGHELGKLGGAGEIVGLGRSDADLRDPEVCAARIAGTDADAVINAAAWTAVDAAEDEPGTVMRVNAQAPGAMARAAAARGLPFVHISSDYVFDGSGDTPWSESDPVNPQSVYGSSKAGGEAAVAAAGGTYAVLRTSWVFSAHGGNFVKTMLRLAQSRDQLDVVGDQIGGPTAAADIAAACLVLARALTAGGKGGIYHYSGAPDVSWADFARAIFSASGRDVAVRSITTQEYPTRARRPANSRLDCSRIAADHGLKRPDWRKSLQSVLNEIDATNQRSSD